VNGDPVSWLLIEPGWKVLDTEGRDVGHVEEIVGDTGADIFNGLSISIGFLKGHRYVPAERVARITEGRIQLDLTRKELDALDKYERPPVSEHVLPPDRER
jgi:hypothetical protein